MSSTTNGCCSISFHFITLSPATDDCMHTPFTGSSVNSWKYPEIPLYTFNVVWLQDEHSPNGLHADVLLNFVLYVD